MNESFDAEKWIRPGLESFCGYSACKSADVIGEQLGADASSIVKLDANENPYGAAPSVAQVLGRNNFFHIYPDAEQTETRRLLSAYCGVKPENIVMGSGSDQLIDLLIRLFVGTGEEIINMVPTFAMYKFYADLNQCQVVSVARDANFAVDVAAVSRAITPKSKLLFLANPNNPTGTLTERTDVLRLMDLGLPTVVDEAYFEFTGESIIDQMECYPNLMILRTFSKWAGLAGLRVGYGVFPEKIAAYLHAIRDPYNLNSAAVAAVGASLKELPYLSANVRKIVAERDRLFSVLQNSISWLFPYPSRANFILCRVDRDSASKLQTKLERRGILTRCFSGGMLNNCIRFSVGKPEENDILLEALKTIGEE